MSNVSRWVLGVVGFALFATMATSAGAGTRRQRKQVLAALFTPSGQCVTCHNQLTTPDGRDVSLGTAWSASLMANSARDPYWQAAVRRETLEHPTKRRAIEDECAKCHMPAARFLAHQQGDLGQVFANLPAGPATLAPAPHAALATDGVTCSVCHQIGPERLGTRASFVGGFAIDTTRGRGQRAAYGPFEVDPGRARVMRTSSGFQPQRAEHIRQSELCATCHTLYTHALGPTGEVIGELPEQVPYLEWQASEYPGRGRSCQSCHMPPLSQPTAISSVLPQPRLGMAPHVFRGGNSFMLRVLSRYGRELGVAARPTDFASIVQQTVEHLEQKTAQLRVTAAPPTGGRLLADVSVENLAGHKLPTAYPSRRVWIHLVVRDRAGGLVFESGRLGTDGAISGNDNDLDPARFEPHHLTIERADQVQIFEAILGAPDGRVTTGLLTASRYLKDNRVLPRGFDKDSVPPDIAVHGAALTDPEFAAGRTRTRYAVPIGSAEGPFTIEAELWYQSIGFRWAMNLKPFRAFEPRRFVRYYESMAETSGVRLAASQVVVGHSK